MRGHTKVVVSSISQHGVYQTRGRLCTQSHLLIGRSVVQSLVLPVCTLHVIFGQDSEAPVVPHASIRACAHVLDKMLVGECGFSYHGDVSQEDVCALNFYFIFWTGYQRPTCTGSVARWSAGVHASHASLFFTEISGSRGASVYAEMSLWSAFCHTKSRKDFTPSELTSLPALILMKLQ